MTVTLPTELWRNVSVGVFLFSHLVAKALSSALQSLTSVFGMGTGGPSASSTPTLNCDHSVSIYIKRTQVRFNQTGDSCGNRTRVAGVRGRSLNRLTNEPFLLTKDSFEPLVSLGAPSGARTRDTLIKSQVLYQLS